MQSRNQAWEKDGSGVGRCCGGGITLMSGSVVPLKPGLGVFWKSPVAKAFRAFFLSACGWRKNEKR